MAPASTLAYVGRASAPVAWIAASRGAVRGSPVTVNCAPARSIPAACAAWHSRTAGLTSVYTCGVTPARRVSASQPTMGDGSSSVAGSARRVPSPATRQAQDTARSLHR